MKREDLRGYRKPLQAPGHGALLLVLMMAITGSPVTTPAGAQTASEARAADQDHWLVMVDGHRIRTRGDYRLEKRRVVFVDEKGELRSIRLDQVDLDASGPIAATDSTPRSDKTSSTGEEAVAPALVLDERSIATYGGSADGAKTPEEGTNTPSQSTKNPGASEENSAKRSSTNSRTGASLEVASWSIAESDDTGMTVYGTLKNSGNRASKRPRVLVQLLDERGEKVAEVAARVTNPELRPGKSTNFRARFGRYIAYSTVEFQVTLSNP